MRWSMTSRPAIVLTPECWTRWNTQPKLRRHLMLPKTKSLSFAHWACTLSKLFPSHFQSSGITPKLTKSTIRINHQEANYQALIRSERFRHVKKRHVKKRFKISERYQSQTNRGCNLFCGRQRCTIAGNLSKSNSHWIWRSVSVLWTTVPFFVALSFGFRRCPTCALGFPWARDRATSNPTQRM